MTPGFAGNVTLAHIQYTSSPIGRAATRPQSSIIYIRFSKSRKEANMNSLNITLPPDVFKTILAGEKRFVTHKRNPRIDRYFAAKKPDKAKINGRLFAISKIKIDSDSIHIHIS
jgi:hypothetical protein